MSRTYSTEKGKNQKHPKVNYREYFSNPNEPRENLYNDMPAELEVELLENSGVMKREFRRFAQRRRNRYA